MVSYIENIVYVLYAVLPYAMNRDSHSDKELLFFSKKGQNQRFALKIILCNTTLPLHSLPDFSAYRHPDL